jgi:hypothetical protein
MPLVFSYLLLSRRSPCASSLQRTQVRTFPLDIVSNQPQVVSEWLTPGVPFRLTLPNLSARRTEAI